MHPCIRSPFLLPGPIHGAQLGYATAISKDGKTIAATEYGYPNSTLNSKPGEQVGSSGLLLTV